MILEILDCSTSDFQVVLDWTWYIILVLAAAPSLIEGWSIQDRDRCREWAGSLREKSWFWIHS
jgi:hypothetical protein